MPVDYRRLPYKLFWARYLPADAVIGAVVGATVAQFHEVDNDLTRGQSLRDIPEIGVVWKDYVSIRRPWI